MVNEGMECIYVSGVPMSTMANLRCPKSILDNFEVVIMVQGFFCFGDNKKEVYARAEKYLEGLAMEGE